VTLTDAVREVLGKAITRYRDQPHTVELLRRQLVRLDEPLRVAIAGKVKAGKSTLLNALVGEAVAPTDAGECTKVVTWYRDGSSPRVTMYPRQGPPRALPVVRRDGALDLALGARAEDVDRLVVDWPATSLRTTTLIDTPGVASVNKDVSARAERFLDPDDDTPTEADAVIYLMRHLHSADADFLESFRDRGVARATAVTTVAVLSRADEIGGGGADAMFSARGIATRYRSEPALRGLCQNVVAVAGLLAHTGRTLRQAEFAALADLAASPREDLEKALLSADRFTRLHGGHELVGRFGLFGIRLATSLLRQGTRTPAELAGELVARSGLGDLRKVLTTQFTERRDLLKARSALVALERITRADDRGLARDVERILAGAHEFTELRLLSALRAGTVVLPKPLIREAERLLGDDGGTPGVRLGLPAAADAIATRAAALAALRRWHEHAENPALGRRASDACRVLVRTCEGLVARV
jgi:dynamin family protein